MTTMRTRLLGLVMATGLAATAALAVPPALDRVSADTPVIIGVQSMSGLIGDAKHWAGTFAPPEAAMGLMMVEQMLQIPGLNAEGSAAIALSFPNGFEAEPVPVVILPVSDFAALSEAMQGNAADGVTALNLNGETMYAKDLGDGFIAMGPAMDLIEGFDGSKGRSKAHAERLGSRGAKASDQADIFAVIDLKAMRPVLDEALAQMEEQMEFAAMMAGEAAAAQMQTMANAAKAVVEDGRTAFIGMGAGEDGMWLDFAGQFTDGSETGAVFQGSGDSTPMFAALPDMDFIFASAFDTSSPGIRKLMTAATSMSQGMTGGMKTEEMVELSDGSAMLMGTTPGLFAGGLFTNTVSYTASKNPKKLLEAMKSGATAMDGQSNEGVLFHTTWQDAAAEVAGHTLDAWGFTMEGDPNHPNGAQAGMMLQQMTMLFGGQAGPSGYVTTTDSGLYSSFSKNSKLMERVLAGEGAKLSANESIQLVAKHLPEDRTGEAYLNIKGVLDMVIPIVQMMGAGADLGEMPESMNPIAMGLATGEGGMHARVFVPADVLQFAGKLAQQMNAEDEWEEVEEPDSKPRF
jgi:hypothetical protein